jgi:riboflavin kinase/FMN adenylyltransferase
MKIIRDIFSLHNAFPRAALTIGNFDGVHLGHRRIVEETVAAARTAGGPALAFTFDPHPEIILRGGPGPGRLLSFERRLELLHAAGIETVICPDDPRAVLDLSAEDFVQRIIVAALGAAVIVEGPSFHFGRGGKGNDELLRRLGPAGGFSLVVVPPLQIASQEVSSTLIRQAVRDGRLADANLLLGRPFEITGRVVPGLGRGRKLGFPTANLEGDFLVPADGVYATRAIIDDRSFAAPVSIGHASTFGDLEHPLVEAHLLDFDGDLYGRTMRVEFIKRLRDQKKFSGPDALIRQIRSDCDAVRQLLSPHR